MRRVIKDICTEDDGESYCMARICTLAGVTSYLTIGLSHAFMGTPLDYSSFGSGFGYILGGGGVAVGLKQYTTRGN